MNGYPLARILMLRERKAERAQIEVSKCRRLLEEAIERAEEADRVAKAFAKERPSLEAALFEKIRNKILERPQLDRYHEEIAELAAHELKLFELAELEWAKVKAAEKALEEAVEAYKQAVRDVKKFEEHRAIWWAAEKRRLEELQELEAEETATLSSQKKKY